MALDVPVIILNWNGIDDTIECVASLKCQQNSHPIIYIGDNASANDEGQRLFDYYLEDSDVIVHLYGMNHGFAKGCNLLIEEALRDYPDSDCVALLNNDAIVAPDWLNQLYTTMQTTQAGMVGSKLISYYDRTTLDNVGHQMLSSGEIIPIGNKASVDLYQDSMTNFGCCAAGVLYSREMLDQIGLFDTYFHTGYEDAELGARALISGYNNVYCPTALVYHKVSQSVKKVFNEDYLKIIQKSIYYSYLKLSPILLIFWTLPGIIFKLGVMFCLNTITRQWHRNRIHRDALRSIWKDRQLIKSKRQEFFGNVTPISSYQIRSKQLNWVTFDAKRFWRFYILGERSQFEKTN